jgi:hypothetical protein
MAVLTVRVCNAKRQPLDDKMDVHVVSAQTDSTVGVARGVSGRAAVKFEKLDEGRPYLVKVFPMRHRPVAQFVVIRPGESPTVQLFAPVDPERVSDVRFPEYDAIPSQLRQVLDSSVCEGITGSGAALYTGLTSTQRAGLFNLFAKMSAFGFDDQRTVWSFVERVYRVRPDRIFVDVQPPLRDLVKGAIGTGRFREVSGSLHTPPAGFLSAGSFKTPDTYGNLQLSFFSSANPPLAFKVDADIDDAAGLGHAFQVIRNHLTQGTTHPYDIHEILVFRQEVVLPYELA